MEGLQIYKEWYFWMKELPKEDYALFLIDIWEYAFNKVKPSKEWPHWNEIVQQIEEDAKVFGYR